MAANTSVLDGLLKNMYLPRLRGQFYKAIPAYKRIQSTSDKSNFQGRQVLIGAHFQRSEAVGARLENAALPNAQYQQIADLTIPVAYNYGKIKLSNQVIKTSQTNEGAFARALQVEMDGIKESLQYDMARQLVYGDATGKIATTNGAGAASTSLIVATTPGTSNLRVGMTIDIFTPGGVQEVTAAKITAVASSTNTVTLATPQTWSNGSYVYREGARNAEMMGLGGIVDDGTIVATFQGLARSTNTWLQANIVGNSGVNRNLTLRLVDDAALAAEKQGGGGYPTAIYSKHTTAQDYADLVRVDRRFTPDQMVLDGGYKAVRVTHAGGECPWISDRMVRANQALFVNEDDITRFSLEELGWFDEDGTILHRALDGSDSLEASLREYSQIGATRCSGQTALQDLTQS